MAHGKYPSQARERSRDERPHAHSAQSDALVKMVNGRLVSKTLADPELKGTVRKASKSIYPNKKAFVEEMARRGVLTRQGKLTKASGG